MIKSIGHITIECAVCGRKKKVSRSWAKYCSNRCKAIGWGVSKAKEIKNIRIKND